MYQQYIVSQSRSLFIAAADQAVVALTGTNSPISAGDIYRVAGMTSEPQLTDSQYTAGIVTDGCSYNICFTSLGINKGACPGKGLLELTNASNCCINSSIVI